MGRFADGRRCGDFDDDVVIEHRVGAAQEPIALLGGNAEIGEAGCDLAEFGFGLARHTHLGDMPIRAFT